MSRSATRDTIVVGGGLIGLSIGWRAARLGLDVTVLEQDSEPSHEICSKDSTAATAVAAGMLAPVTEATFGESALLALNLASARRWPDFLAELAAETGHDLTPASRGTLAVAADRDQLEALRRLHAFQRSLGLEATWLGHVACRELEPSLHPSVRGGVLVPGDRDVDPRRVARAAAAALEGAGGSIRYGAAVTEITVRDGRAVGVRLSDGGAIAAGTVVLAAGCWSGGLEGVPREVAASVRPVKGQILRLRPRPGDPPLIAHVIRTEEMYLVPRAGGGMVLGATVEERGFDRSLTAGAVFELLRAAAEAVPGIRELEIVEAGAGLRPGTPDNGPLIGHTSVDGLVAATGHFRNGILQAPLTADAIAALLAGEDLPAAVAPFTPSRFARFARTQRRSRLDVTVPV
jgi:glycine oxidase